MAGTDEAKKVKKEKADKSAKPEKEKKVKKEKSEGDKSSDRKAKDSSSKESKKDASKAPEKKKDRPSSSSSSAPVQQTRTPPPRPPPKKLAPAANDDYLAGIDLPSSSDSEDDYDRDREIEKGPLMVQATDREVKKLADKERLAMEKALAAKAAAIREDENVFDVSFEGQGNDEMASATDVKVHNLTVRAKGKVLLENTQLTIAAGRRYGLAGPNGKGKTTLLKLMARRQIPVPDTIDVLLVEQEVVGSDDQTALQAVVAADVELMELRAEEARLQDDLNEDPHPAHFDADAATHRLNEIYERMNEMGASTAESRAAKILHGLGFTEGMRGRPTSSFSGGWRMRISLARALYIQPTLLLLDEPTNHLDLRAVLWLEEYLMRWKKTLIVVSHDRDFLNNITTDIIHLHDCQLHFYRGNFAQFESMYEQKRTEVNKAFEKYEKQMRAAKQSGKNSKAAQEKVKASAARQAAKRGSAGGKGGSEAEGAGRAAPQKWSDYSVEFHFPEPTELPPPLMQLIDASFKYPGRDDFGLHDVNLGITMGSRVAVVGPNGAGKTTLMNLLSGDLVPTEGESRRSQKLRIGRYNQHFVDALSMDVNPVEYLLTKFPEAGLKGEQMRAMLGKFGLSGHHHLTPICKLSGGQKARVVFTSISLARPHILLLDEPTNHLDMQSIDALCDALDEFTGGVVVISHDAQLISRLCADEERAEVWIVDNGEIEFYDGNFDDYRDELIKEITAELDEE